MITVYEIKPNGFLGVSKEIDPREGVGAGWTYTPPPAEGPHKWESSQWIKADEPDQSTPGPNLEAMVADVRAERNKRLAETDWVVIKALEAGTAVPADVAAKRQALRDVPQQAGFPWAVEWPE